MDIQEIKATARVSFKQTTKSGDVFYTYEYTESHSVNPNESEEEQRKNLWNIVNNEVNNQIIETKSLYQEKV